MNYGLWTPQFVVSERHLGCILNTKTSYQRGVTTGATATAATAVGAAVRLPTPSSEHFSCRIKITNRSFAGVGRK